MRFQAANILKNLIQILSHRIHCLFLGALHRNDVFLLSIEHGSCTFLLEMR